MFLYINFLDLTKVASCIGKYKYTFVEVLNNLSNGVLENGKISLIYLLIKSMWFKVSPKVNIYQTIFSSKETVLGK